MRDWLTAVWYDGGRGGWLLWPLSVLFGAIAATRRLAFHLGLFASHRVEACVIVVGNIAVGGAGKSPVTGWLATELAKRSHSVAIVSRGYGGTASTAQAVDVNSDPSVVGDEALMLARATGLPVFVGRDRVSAARLAVSSGARVVICDDGLQHYRLQRDIEFVVVDGVRGHGNGRLLPAGPLREPVSRLQQVARVITNGGQVADFTLQVDRAINQQTGEQRELSQFQHQPVHAVAGIANPQRFFDSLVLHGIHILPTPLGDHQAAKHTLEQLDSRYDVLMTDKDAVKYSDLDERFWRVPAVVLMDRAAAAEIITLVERAVDTRQGGVRR